VPSRMEHGRHQHQERDLDLGRHTRLAAAYQGTSARASPAAAPPATSQAELTRQAKRASAAASARPAVGQSTTAARPSSQVTSAMSATAAALAPSRKPAADRERRSRGMSGFDSATKTKDGRKMAAVATRAPGTPARR